MEQISTGGQTAEDLTVKAGGFRIPLCAEALSVRMAPERAFSQNLDYAALQGDGHRVSAIVRAELRKNTPHVAFDGFLGNGEVIGDDFIGVAGSHQPQNLDLSFGQCVIRLMFRHLNGDLGGNSFSAGVNTSNGLDQFLSYHALQEISGRLARRRYRWSTQ